MKIQLYKADGGGETPIHARTVLITLFGGKIRITFPLPYLEVYTYHDVPGSPGDVEPFRLFPPERYWRKSRWNPANQCSEVNDNE